MTVKRIDGTSFEVSSVDDQDPYLVVVAPDDGPFVVCSCRDFQCRCQPALDRGAKIRQYGYTGRTICKHIQQVMLYLGASVIASVNGLDVDDVYEQVGNEKPKQQNKE